MLNTFPQVLRSRKKPPQKQISRNIKPQKPPEKNHETPNHRISLGHKRSSVRKIKKKKKCTQKSDSPSFYTPRKPVGNPRCIPMCVSAGDRAQLPIIINHHTSNHHYPPPAPSSSTKTHPATLFTSTAHPLCPSSTPHLTPAACFIHSPSLPFLQTSSTALINPVASASVITQSSTSAFIRLSFTGLNSAPSPIVMELPEEIERGIEFGPHTFVRK